MNALLTDNWTAANTNDRTPEIEVNASYGRKKVSTQNDDFIFLYETNEELGPYGMGAKSWEEIAFVSADIWTTYGNSPVTTVRAHTMKMKGEVLRIVKSKVITPGTGYNIIVPIRKKDRSDETHGRGRIVMDFALKHWGT